MNHQDRLGGLGHPSKLRLKKHCEIVTQSLIEIILSDWLGIIYSSETLLCINLQPRLESGFAKSVGLIRHSWQILKMSDKELQLNSVKCPNVPQSPISYRIFNAPALRYRPPWKAYLQYCLVPSGQWRIVSASVYYPGASGLHHYHATKKYKYTLYNHFQVLYSLIKVQQMVIKSEPKKLPLWQYLFLYKVICL